MKLTRRQFIKGVASTGVFVCGSSWFLSKYAFSSNGKSRIFKVERCPVHDGELRHEGVDALFDLLAASGINLYITGTDHPWGGIEGLIASDDVVLIKVNCQWKCRGTTNTDVLRGLIYRILQHPDGFRGEVVIFENGQGRGGFDGLSQGGSVYSAWPAIANGIYVNAEEENLLTVDYLVHTVFKDDPVSCYLLDPIRSNFMSDDDHLSEGYRRISNVSYPCFTSERGHRIELREGIWNGTGHDTNLKLINLPVFKHHAGTGITGALKHSYGILSMADGFSKIGNENIRHYRQSGDQCGKMWSLVRIPDLNIVDCIWVSPNSLRGYPRSTTYRANTLLAGFDPVALDYHASKHILYPVGGIFADEHDPDAYPGLKSHLTGALTVINSSGGIGGEQVHTGDENIELAAAVLSNPDAGGWGEDESLGESGDGASCFISTMIDR